MENLYTLETILEYLEKFTRTFCNDDAKSALTELIQDQLDQIQDYHHKIKYYTKRQAGYELKNIIRHTKISNPNKKQIIAFLEKKFT